jgi:hypothetical protein
MFTVKLYHNTARYYGKLVALSGYAIIHCLIRTLKIVEIEASIKTLMRFFWRSVSNQIDFFILECAPKIFGEDTVGRDMPNFGAKTTVILREP